MSLRAALMACAILASCDRSAVAVRGQQPARSEYEIKAAYLYTFGRFVEWPAARTAGEFAICVLGVDPFGRVLDVTLAGTVVRGRKVVLRRLASAADAPRCHIVFIAASEQQQLPAIMGRLGRTGVLTVSDMPQFVGRGGMIQFHTSDNRVRFQIDLQPARDAGLTVSSDLLSVASSVQGRPGA